MRLSHISLSYSISYCFKKLNRKIYFLKKKRHWISNFNNKLVDMIQDQDALMTVWQRWRIKAIKRCTTCVILYHSCCSAVRSCVTLWGWVDPPGVHTDPVYLTDVLLKLNPAIGQTKVIYLDVVALQKPLTHATCGLAYSWWNIPRLTFRCGTHLDSWSPSVNLRHAQEPSYQHNGLLPTPRHCHHQLFRRFAYQCRRSDKWHWERKRVMFYLTTHSTHFIYGYMAWDIWLRIILIVRKETRCRHRLLLSINSKGYFICTIPHTG